MPTITWVSLAVGIGKIQEALRFFETALEANADVAQFWVSYIDALMRVGRMGDAQAVLDQAKSNGAQGEGFDQLEAEAECIGPSATYDLFCSFRSTFSDNQIFWTV